LVDKLFGKGVHECGESQGTNKTTLGYSLQHNDYRIPADVHMHLIMLEHTSQECQHAVSDACGLGEFMQHELPPSARERFLEVPENDPERLAQSYGFRHQLMQQKMRVAYIPAVSTLSGCDCRPDLCYDAFKHQSFL
jgi:hypothetical protein